MTTTLVFYVESMPGEVAAAALFKLVPNTMCAPLTVNEARDRAFIEKIIDAANAEEILKRVLFFGTYCRDENFEYFATKLSKTATVHVYDFGSPLPEAKQSATVVRFFGGQEQIGLASFAMTFLAKHKLPYVAPKGVSAEVLQLIDARTLNQKQDETQLLVSGMCAVGSPNTKLIDKFVDLFTDKIRLEEVLALGKTVAETHATLATLRALNSSGEMKLADGTTAAIGPAPDLVNLGHVKLHEKYPDAQVTITVALSFKGRPTLSLSIRSYDKKIDAGAMARMIKDKDGKQSGDGSADAGGGRTDFVLDLPF